MPSSGRLSASTPYRPTWPQRPSASGSRWVEAASLESLRREATEGRTLKANVEREKVKAAVGDAISKGKIAASLRKHWVALIGADPGMAEVLASTPNETAVPTSEIGHSVGSESNELAETAEWFADKTAGGQPVVSVATGCPSLY